MPFFRYKSQSSDPPAARHSSLNDVTLQSALQPLIAAVLVVCLLTCLGGVQVAHAADIAVSDGLAESVGQRMLGIAGVLTNGTTLRPRDKCPISVTGNVTCADLIVPERREVPGSRMITVRVAVLHAQEEDGRHHDPFVFLMGGQGQGFSVLNELAALPSLLRRDVITLEQRGTQLADPFFGCPGVKSGVTGIDQVLTSQPSSADPCEIERCKAEIERAGVDRNGYDTAANADDLWDLKQLLGVEQWNLFGVSYGGRTAETFLRKHPGGARSLVLDSPQVTGIPIVFGYARLAKIGEFFSRCAAADGCGRQFRDLRGHFERTVARLERRAVPVIVAGERQILTAAAYIRVVTWILYSKPESAVADLPAAIVAAAGGDYAPLLALEDRYADAAAPDSTQPGDYPIALGSHIAQQTQVLCAEEYSYLPRHEGQINLTFPEGWSPAIRRVAVAEQHAQAWVCDQWGFKPSDSEQGTLPPRNEIPTLIVHGDHDTIAPSQDQHLLTRSYPRSTRVVFPWTGHAIIERRQECFLPMLLAFIESPTAPVDTTCVARVREPQWLPRAPQAGRPASYLTMMQTVAANQVKEHGFPGRTVHMELRQAHISGTVAVGLADPATGRQLTGQEPSRMASMTKTYTAAAVLRLVETGKVNLDGGAGQYLTNETQQLLRSGDYDPSAMTVKQLLQHTSGLPDYTDPTYRQRLADEPYHRWTRREQVKWALDHAKPTGAPGKVFAYSDTGYVLLGEIIEQISRQPQALAYRTLLGIDRLRLRHTWFESLESAPADLPERAHQFFGSFDGTNLDPSFDLWGGGGLVATVDDEATFLRALMTGHVFDHRNTLTTMLTVPATNTDASYGMGILRVSAQGVSCWSHSGFWGTSFYYCPSIDVTLASDRYQSITPALDYDPLQILATAFRINRLVTHPALQTGDGAERGPLLVNIN
jgi:D-alanyl-D-alanine carboxypeptidase